MVGEKGELIQLNLKRKRLFKGDLWKTGITIKVDIKCLHQQLHLVCSNNT